MTRSTEAGIRIRGLTMSYGSLEVIRDLDLDLAPNRVHGLLGPNGAGKTTLLAGICNHTFRTAGTILVDGEDPAENAPVLARTCFVREDQRYNDAFRVRDILRVLPSFYTEWDDALADRLVGRFALPVERSARKLSRGQRSAFAIITALASCAPYTFLDEPYLGLDPSAREIFYEELMAEVGRRPRTIVMSTHLVDEAADLMEEVIVLQSGSLVLQTDVDAARASAFVARGRADDVRAFATGRDVVAENSLGPITAATIRGRATADDEARAIAARVSLEPAGLQDLIAALGVGALTSIDASGDHR
jgi:ABC-2 type transport system ATP-binding protein